jgi:hypothetical protein
MLGKTEIESIVGQLKQEWGKDSSWEQILRDAYLAIARTDAGVPIGDLDPRVCKVIQQHQK